MRAHVRRVLLLILSFFLLTGGAEPKEGAFRAEVFPEVVRQGDVCLVRASGLTPGDAVQAVFQDRKFPMAIQGRDGRFGFLLGIDMETRPGDYEIRIEHRDRSGEIRAESLLLKVKRARFGRQSLSLPDSMVDLDAETLARVDREAGRLEAIFLKSRDERIWDGSFAPPLKGKVITPFGIRRIINGQEKRPHTGVDLRAKEGTAVLAGNKGVVILSDALFFSGKSVILDHGEGIYSMYFHLSKAAVSEGETVKKGAILGRVGSTGRSTGPHLHWGVRMNGSRVNPFALLKTTKNLRE